MLNDIGYIQKGWGGEYIFASTDKYCGKFLMFNQGAQFSMHFHAEKDETWVVIEGEFIVECIDTSNGRVESTVLKEGSIWRNRPLEPHRLRCVREGVIVEVSSPDHKEDNYRVMPGDSQK